MSSTILHQRVSAAAAGEFSSHSGLLVSPRDWPAWAISVGLHALILLLFASITMVSNPQSRTVLTSVFEDTPPDEVQFDATLVDQVGSDTPNQTLTAPQAAAGQMESDPHEDLKEQLDEEILTVDAPVTDVIGIPNAADFVESFVPFGSTEHPGGVEGAIDRLTFEIAASLKERKTLAVWLFDASQSLKERREAIADRFENVYRQLGQLNVDQGGLRTGVVSFGKTTSVLTATPVDDYREVVKAVHNVAPDESGVENVFSAVHEVANRWKTYRTKMHYNVMLIIVTDERGDDYALMEDVIHELRRWGMRVYCVGNTAPFGREKRYVNFKDEDGYMWHNVEVDQGPETVAPERLDLAFWGTPARDLEGMTSGFGPYALTRLCAETGGLYLIAAESSGPQFDPAVMRNYLPDYRPIRDYQQQLKDNLAKGALVRAAMTTKAEQIPTPQLQFRADNDNVLRREITEGQKPLARLDYRLAEMMTILTEGEKDRPKLTDPRWQASFDLAMGRVLAMRVRAYGYNAVLAEMKSSPKPFQKEGSNMWRLIPSEEITAGAQVKRLADKAVEILKRIIAQHPGTPWALLAQRELDQPLGWQWKEGTMVIPNAGSMPNNRNPLQLADDADPKKKNEKKERPQPPRVRPKL